MTNAPEGRMIECTCSVEFRRGHFGHDEGCPLEAALEAAYCRGWREGQADPDWKEPEKLLRVWAS
jgi:hypothetical protein